MSTTSSPNPISSKTQYQLLSEILNTQVASDKIISELETLYKDDKGEKQVPKDYYADLNYCGQPLSIFCYENPSNCKNVFDEYIKNTTLEGIKSSDNNVYHQICDEAKKSNGRIKNEDVRKSILKSCDQKYATNICLDKDKRYSNPNKETFAGNCMNICKQTKDVDLKLACTIGTINYCLKNKDKLSGENCIFRDYFDVDGPTLQLKNFPNDKDAVKKEIEFMKKNGGLIQRYKDEYCSTFKEDNKPGFCLDTIPTAVPSSVQEESSPSTKKEQPKKKQSKKTQPKKPDDKKKEGPKKEDPKKEDTPPPPPPPQNTSSTTPEPERSYSSQYSDMGKLSSIQIMADTPKVIPMEDPRPDYTAIIIIIIIAYACIVASSFFILSTSNKPKKIEHTDTIEETEIHHENYGEE